VPQGGATKNAPGAQEELFKIVTNVNQVLVPVTVKDESGHLVNGLLPKNFVVIEGGRRQTLNFFTSDPFAAVGGNHSGSRNERRRCAEGQPHVPTLQGVFSPFDEVSIYSYSTP